MGLAYGYATPENKRDYPVAVTNLRDAGKVPPNVDNVELDKVRAATLRLPIDADWKMASAAARQAVLGKPSAGDLPTIL
jgi:hypothetical protein